MSELVSILIPAFNAEKWIGQAVESALDQTWPNKEIIIVDDGSSDDTLNIARRFESGSVKVLTQENRGASAARNKALSISQGDYIQWLDADDLLESHKISEQMKKIELDGNGTILLSGAFGSFYYRKSAARFSPTLLWRDLSPVEYLALRFSQNLWMSPAVWLVSRRLAELAGPWDERLSLNDDGEYFARVITNGEKIRFVPEAKSYYRQGNIGSLSRSLSDKACTSLYLSVNLSIRHLRSLEDSERTRSACLQLLQSALIYFYPDKTAFLERAEALAKELGGELLPPALGWKYSLIRRVFGWSMAKGAQRGIPMFKELVRKNWDRLLYSVSI